jgi:hypothetical protein
MSFYGVNVLIESTLDSLLSLLKKDFSFFVVESLPVSTMGLAITVKKENYQDKIPKNLVAISQSQTCLTYEENHLRYNDYYGEALAIFNYAQESCEIFGEDEARLHEIVYLIILSRVGLMHDKIGIHRLHAFAVNYHDVNLVGMMPMKGGKSTLFMNLIQNPAIEILSDDSPLIDQQGKILPFPIRLGLQEKPEGYAYYTMNRKLYGEKYLIDVADLKSKIGTEKPFTVLFQGRRSTYNDCQIIHCSKLKMLVHLSKNLVVGLGLPMVIEYFFMTGLQDKIEKVKITWLRVLASLHLLMKSDCYEIYLTSHPEKNTKAILEFIENHFPREAQ